MNVHRPNFCRAAPLAIVCALLALATTASSAPAARPLLSEAALKTDFCNHCPPISKPPPFVPPSEGEIEGACGLAIRPSGGIYLSDYYHRVIDSFQPYNGANPATYESQISLPGANPVFGTNTLDAVCSLALDAEGNLYANEFHQRVVQLTPAEVTIDSGESTGLAIDPSTNRLYVDDRTYIAEYELPFSVGDPPVAKFGADIDADYFGLAARDGVVYVADAADQSIKVFEPPTNTPGHTIPVSNALTDASMAVDPTNGHLLVVENSQPLFEHPKSIVREFGSPAEAYAPLGALPGSPIFGGPSGIAVSSAGVVLVTDGNSELANVFAYGPYGGSSFAAPDDSSTLATTSTTSGPPLATPALTPALSAVSRPSTQARHRKHRHRRHRRDGAGGRR